MQSKEVLYIDLREVWVITGLTLTCTLLFSLNCLVGKSFYDEVNSEYYTKDIKEYPFFCEDLSLSPDEDEDTFDAVKHNFKTLIYKDKYVCVYRNLSKVIKKFVERKSRLRFASGQDGQRFLQCGNDNLKEPSGQLSASFTKVSKHQTFQGRNLDLLIHWDKHQDTSFISDSLTYHKGEIKVPDRRFYFLYASILINISGFVNQFRGEKASTRRFVLRVCVKRNGFEFMVLHKAITYTLPNKDGMSSLSVGGHLHLEKEDSVYVKVSEGNRIIRNSVGNTFGIIPLK